MIALLLRGLAARRLRTALTGLAVLLGVAMVAGTFIQTDRIRDAFTGLLETANAGSDAVITHRQAFEGQFGETADLDASLVERVAAIDGVARAVGELTAPASLVVDGELVESEGFAGGFVLSALPQPFDPTRVVAGRRPAARGELAVDRETAEEEGIDVGDRVALATASGLNEVEVVGVITYGEVSRLVGARIFSAVLADVQAWSKRDGKLQAVLVSSEPGVTPETLVRRLRPALGRDVEVRTGEANAAKTADDISDQIGTFLLPALLALAGAAVIVGAFIIFNTSSITVAQRTREFALLRTLGASRPQILLSVAGEAVLIGLVASLLGLAAGAGFAEGLTRLFDAAGFALPASGLPIHTRTVVIALTVGIGVSLLASLVPARRATRVAPGLALRTALLDEAPRRRRWAPWVAGACVALGAAGVLNGALGSGPTEARLGAIGGGAVLGFVGLALSARWFVRPLARVLGRPLERLSPVPGRLARENAERNPGRTAVTAAALMVGLALVVFIAVFADGLKTTLTGSLERLIVADHVLVGESQTQPVSAEAIAAARETPGVRAAVGMYFDQVRVNERRKPNTTTDTLEGIDRAQLREVYEPEWVSGPGDGVLERFGGEQALVEEQFAREHGLGDGEAFTVTTPSGGRLELRVLARYRDPVILTGVIVDEPEFQRASSMIDPFLVFVRSEDGADEAGVGRALRDALAEFPATEVQTTDEYREDLEGQLNQLVYLLYALLAMCVLISLLGIANTLFLAVYERTREIGLLRALGADRRQIRQVVRYESVITAVLGGLLGLVAGVALGWVATEALSDVGLVFSLPATQLLVFLVAAALVGVLAAALPARRAARLEVLEALREE